MKKDYERYSGDNEVEYKEEDCYKVDVRECGGRYNIYLYDGNHSNESHYKALMHYESILEEEYIYIVDDWNWNYVRDGTYRSIEELGMEVKYEREIIKTWNNEHTPIEEAKREWWNGIYIGILKKGRKGLKK